MPAYRVEHRRYKGLPISIEQRRGGVRKWYDPLTGRSGKTKFRYPYGYIRGTEGEDRDHLDVFLGPNEASEYVFIIHQKSPETDLFDEDKVMLGFDGPEQAIDAYLAHYDNPAYFGSWDYMDFAEFKAALPACGEGRKLTNSGSPEESDIADSESPADHSSSPQVPQLASVLPERDKLLEIQKALSKEKLEPIRKESGHQVPGNLSGKTPLLLKPSQRPDRARRAGRNKEVRTVIQGGRIIAMPYRLKDDCPTSPHQFPDIEDLSMEKGADGDSEPWEGISTLPEVPDEETGDRYSYCELLLAHCREECGELPLCVMRRKWKPIRERRLQSVEKSYSPKADEHWITVHPNGDENKGQPVLIKEHPDGTASVIAGVGGELNGLRLRRYKSREEYHAQVKARREEIQARKTAEKARIKSELAQLSAGERKAVKAQNKAKATEKKAAEQSVKDKAREADIAAARDIAEVHGWVMEDLNGKFDQARKELEEQLEDASGPQKKELEGKLARHEAARRIAIHKQARNVLAQARTAADKLREQMLIDDALRESVRERLADPHAGTVNTEVRGSKRTGVRQDYEKKAQLSTEEREQIRSERERKPGKEQGDELEGKQNAARARERERDEIVRANFTKTEYASPQDTEKKIETLKKLMELEKKQQQIKKERKALEKLNTEGMGADELRGKLEGMQFGDGVSLVRGDLDTDLARYERDVQTARQAALNSTLHDEFVGEGINHVKWLSNGAYNALNSASLDILGSQALDRHVVDILGAGNAAEVMAEQIRREHDDPESVAAAVNEWHTQTNEETAGEALNEGQELLSTARELDPLMQASVDKPKMLRDLVKRKQALIDRASATMGQALGGLEASAALSLALQRQSTEPLTVNLGRISAENAALQAKVLGLGLEDVDIKGVKGERLMIVPRDKLGKILGTVDKEEAGLREEVAAIKAGLRDEAAGWLPDGIISRPFESFSDEGATPATGSVETQQIGNDENTREALHRTLAELPAAKMSYKEPEELSPQEQTALRRYWEDHIYQGSAAAKTDLRAMQQQYREDTGAVSGRKVWNDFVAKHGGAEQAAIEAIRDKLNRESQSEGFGLDFGEPEQHPLAAADFDNLDSFRAIDDERILSLFQSVDGLKADIEQARMFGDSEDVSKLQRQLQQQEGNLRPELETRYKQLIKQQLYKMKGITQGQLDAGAEREIKSPWGEYVRTHGSVIRAREAILDHLRGRVNDKFRRHYADVAKIKLRTDSQKMRNHIEHVMGTMDGELRNSYLERAGREMAAAGATVANRVSGKFAAGSRRDKALELIRKEKEAEAARPGLFDDADIKQKDGTDITRLGAKVEAELRNILPEAGAQFQFGRKVGLFPGLSMGGKYIEQQRAIKMLEATGKMNLTFGTGKGKSLSGIGAYAHLKSKGKAERALFAVPSAVQEQFGEEMQKYTQPGKFSWESRGGLNQGQRMAALKDTNNDINVVTHQSLAQDVIQMLGAHYGASPEQAKNRFNALSDQDRADHLREALEKNGIRHDMVVVDESHYSLDRSGKPDTTSANILTALSHNAKYSLRQSATPVKNDPSEAYDMLHQVDPQRFNDAVEFRNRYGLDTQASRRALRAEIDRYNYASPTVTGVRRNHHTERIQLSEQQRKAYRDVQEAARKASLAFARGETDIESLKILSPKSFSGPEAGHAEIGKRLMPAIGTLRSAAENRVINFFEARHNAKMQKLSRLIEGKKYKDPKGEGQQAPGVVFAHNRESIRQIEQDLKNQGYRVAVIHGGHSSAEKERIKNEFNPPTGDEKERKHDILILSDAGATGINLQNAKYLVNYDLPDTSWVKEQRNGRIDRNGQKHSEIDYHDLISDTDHERNKSERIDRKAALGQIFQQSPDQYDDRGLASYLQKASAERYTNPIQEAA